MTNQRYTPEFKDEAARQIVDRGYSVADVSERLGVSAHSLSLAAAFDLFQYPNYFGFFESCFAHFPFSISASLCRRTPKTPGAILREAYSTKR